MRHLMVHERPLAFVWNFVHEHRTDSITGGVCWKNNRLLRIVALITNVGYPAVRQLINHTTTAKEASKVLTFGE